MDTEVLIAPRFCGPPRSGNGGYCAGLVAAAIAGAVDATFRRPLPLDRPLRLEHGEGAVLYDGDEVLVEARPTRLVLDAVSPPPFEAAERMSRAFRGFARHPFPTCFVCGPARTRGDGLRIFAGGSRDDGAVAAPWIPDHSLARQDGLVRPEFLWAALDCPGYFAVATEGESALLGRMVAEVEPTVRPGERCVVLAWPLSRSGRKLHAASALYDGSGALRGLSSQTWITARDPASAPTPGTASASAG